MKYENVRPFAFAFSVARCVAGHVGRDGVEMVNYFLGRGKKTLGYGFWPKGY